MPKRIPRKILPLGKRFVSRRVVVGKSIPRKLSKAFIADLLSKKYSRTGKGNSTLFASVEKLRGKRVICVLTVNLSSPFMFGIYDLNGKLIGVVNVHNQVLDLKGRLIARTNNRNKIINL